MHEKYRGAEVQMSLQDMNWLLNRWVKQLKPRFELGGAGVYGREHLDASYEVYTELEIFSRELEELISFGESTGSGDVWARFEKLQRQVLGLQAADKLEKDSFDGWATNLLAEVDRTARLGRARGDLVVHFVEENDMASCSKEVQQKYRDVIEIESSIKHYKVLARERKINMGGSWKHPLIVLEKLFGDLHSLKSMPFDEYSNRLYQEHYELLQSLIQGIVKKFNL